MRQEIKTVQADGEQKRKEAEAQFQEVRDRLAEHERTHAVLSNRTEERQQTLKEAASRLRRRRARNLLRPDDPKNDDAPAPEAVEAHKQLQREYNELSKRLDESSEELARLKGEAAEARGRVKGIVESTDRKVRQLKKKLDALIAPAATGRYGHSEDAVAPLFRDSDRLSSDSQPDSASASQPASTSAAPSKDKGPARTPSSIKEAAQRRGIKALVHFTRIENLPTIAANGLLSVDEARQRGLDPLCNDALRLDGLPDYISLSVWWPNWELFYKFRQESDVPEHYWCVLVLAPSILWELPCLFSSDNAAACMESCQPPEKRRTVQAFERMFTDDGGVRLGLKRDTLQIPDCYPTNHQAEVLVHRVVPFNRVLRIVVFNEAGEHRAKKFLPESQYRLLKINAEPFDPRLDWHHWDGARKQQRTGSSGSRHGDANKPFDIDDILF